MTRRIVVAAVVLALIGLTACSASVPVHVKLAPVHATLTPATPAPAGK